MISASQCVSIPANGGTSLVKMFTSGAFCPKILHAWSAIGNTLVETLVKHSFCVLRECGHEQWDYDSELDYWQNPIHRLIRGIQARNGVG